MDEVDGKINTYEWDFDFVLWMNEMISEIKQQFLITIEDKLFLPLSVICLRRQA